MISFLKQTFTSLNCLHIHFTCLSHAFHMFASGSELGYQVAKALQNMAFKSVLAFSVLFLFIYCAAKPENGSEDGCKLLPVGEGLASEFRRKANDKGVRLVYLNLKIGNDSYDPLEFQDVFLPHRWVWANTITEPMLSLLDDYDILSLGLLNYQVRSMDVHLEDQPRGCLVNLNSTYKNLAVGRILLENVRNGRSDELSDETWVVCVAVVERSADIHHQHIDYHCCGVHEGPNGPSILCDLTLDGTWFKGFDGIIIILWILMSLYFPALPLALPDCVFSLRREYDNENRPRKLPKNNVAPLDEQDNTGTADQQNNTGTAEQQNNIGTTDQQNNTGTTDQQNNTGTATDQQSNTGSAADQQNNTGTATDQQSNTGTAADQQNNTGTATDQQINTGTATDQQNNTGTTDAVPLDGQDTIGTADQQNNTGMAEQQNNTGTTDQQNNKMLHVDDASPMTFSHLLQKMSEAELPFNIKLFLVYVFVFPCLVYLELGLYKTLKKTYINESIKRRIPIEKVFTRHVHWSIFVTFGEKEITWIVTLIVTSLAIVLPLRPGNLIFNSRISCRICNEDDGKKRDFHSLGDEMRLHFKIIHTIWWKEIDEFKKQVTDWIPLHPFKIRPQASQTRRVISSISILFMLLIRVGFAAIYFLVFLFRSILPVFRYSPLIFFLWFYVMKEPKQACCRVEDGNVSMLTVVRNCIVDCGRFLVRVLLSLSFCYAVVIVIIVSCGFINKALAYTIAGLVLNEEVITPYVAFFLVVTTNIYLCYSNMQEKYKEVKEMILKCQKKLEIYGNDPEGTIREQLFWFVCEKALPIKSQICLMLRNMVLILTFLFFGVYSVVVFGNEYNTSAIFSTIYVFVGGLIPALVFKGLTKGNKFKDEAKKRIEEDIEKAVREKLTDIESGLYNTDGHRIVNVRPVQPFRNAFV